MKYPIGIQNFGKVSHNGLGIPTDISLLSPNIGIRRKNLDKSSPYYKELNFLIKEIYENFSPTFNADNIYYYIQKIDKRKRIVNNIRNLESIIASIPVNNSKWSNANVNATWGDWVQVIYNRNESISGRSIYNPEIIKVYACVKQRVVQDIFVNSLDYLLKHVEETFAAKLATYSRSDQMCYWLSVGDFHCIQDFFQQYSKDMVKSLPFIAYKGNLGISRDFPGTDYSHNRMQAQIISDYLMTIGSKDDIDLEDMYNNYISKWNGDVVEENKYCGFEMNSVLSFVVITDTLDAILDKQDVSDDSLLMSGDCHLWQTLSQCRSWADLNQKGESLKTQQRQIGINFSSEKKLIADWYVKAQI